jgi:ribosomal protein S8E
MKVERKTELFDWGNLIGMAVYVGEDDKWAASAARMFTVAWKAIGEAGQAEIWRIIEKEARNNFAAGKFFWRGNVV